MERTGKDDLFLQRFAEGEGASAQAPYPSAALPQTPSPRGEGVAPHPSRPSAVPPSPRGEGVAPHPSRPSAVPPSSPSCQPLVDPVGLDKRDTSSKSPRCIRHRRRVGDFPRGEGYDASTRRGSRTRGFSHGEKLSAKLTDEGAQGKATFDELLQDPDYRRAFDERMSAAVRSRFKTVEAQRREMNELARAMADRLGLAVEEGAEVDTEALRRCLARGEAAADEAAEDEPRQADPVPDEADEPRQEMERQAVRGFRTAAAEGEALRALYPGFDLGRELADPRFARLLLSLQRCGAQQPVRTAFEAAHHREILAGALRAAMERTRQQVAEGIRSGTVRPTENGGGSAALTGSDPAHLSAQQRQDIRRRVLRGERISF